VRRYLVRVTPANGGASRSMSVTSPRARLSGVKIGDEIAVRAVNARGMEGWDWVRTVLR
jgi:hypothetical protein